MIINDSTQLLTNLRNDLSVWFINLYDGIYDSIRYIYNNNTNSFNAFFFSFFVVFLSIQQKTVDNPLIPVLYLLFLLLASPILLIVHCASYQTKVMC